MASPGASIAPEFVLRLVEGRGLLGLKRPVGLPLGRFEKLELEVPNLRFPFDGSGDPSRFRNRRCAVREAQLMIEESQLAAWIETRPLKRYGIDELQLRVAGGQLQIAAAITIGGRRASFTCRLHLSTGETRSDLCLRIEELRTYHALPAAAPLVGLALLYGLGARPRSDEDRPPGFVLRGIDAMEIDPIAIALWRSLLPYGWRLPRTDHRLGLQIGVEGQAIRIALSAATLAPNDTQPSTDVDATQAKIVEADRKLAEGSIVDALALYEAAGDDLIAFERRLAVLSALPDRYDEALALGEAVLLRDPERATAMTLLATLLAERGDLGRASDLLQHAAVLAERNGEAAAAIEAALRAAELLLAASRPLDATPLLERVIAGRPTHAHAATLLAERYAAEGRSADLLRLEKRRLSNARGQREEALARVRLGAVWLDHQRDALRARDELERALRLFEGDADTFRLYARALEQAGEITRALEAIEQGLATPSSNEDPLRRADRRFAIELAERAGRLPVALRHAEELLEDHPSDAEGLASLAHLAAASGKFDEAIQAYDRAASFAEDDVARARVYFDLAKLCLAHEHTRAKARVYLDRARDSHPTLEILHAAAELAEAEQRTDDLIDLLLRLGALGDRDARTRRLRLLLTLGRNAEAASEAEALATLGDPAALILLVEARRQEGRTEPLAAALERLVDASREAGPRVELGRIRADQGDLVRARILLEEALPSTLEGDPSFARDALEVLCDVLMRQGDDASLEAALGRLATLRTEPAARALALGAQGAARMRLGRLDAAMTSYREAIAADANDLQARLGLSEAAYMLRLWDEARAALEPLYDAAPRTDRALRLGEIAERQNRAEDAIRFYESALDSGASGADAQRIYVALAALHHARNQWEAEARVLLRAAEDARTTDNDLARAGRLVQAADLFRKRVNRLDESLLLYDRALALDPINLPALDALESIATEREDWSRAAQILSRKVAATAKRPNEQKAILGRLASLQAERLGREDAAREAYSRALAIDPSYRPALIFLARDARERGQHNEERERLERLTSLPADPADPDARLVDLCRLGSLYLDGRPEDAEKMARRVLSEQARHPGALALLDDVFTQLGRYAELESVLAVRAQLETDHDTGVELLIRRAELLERAERVEEAIHTYEQITSIRPGHIVGWTRLAELLRKTSTWPALASALGRLADWQVSNGRREEAAALYVEQAHVLHDHLGEPSRARSVLERAREVWPSSRLVVGALLALARGRADAAEEATLLDQLIELEPDQAARGIAVLERARAMAARGDHEGALRRLRDLPPGHAPEGALRLRVELEEEAGGSSAGTAELLDRLRQEAEESGDVAQERYALARLLRIARDQNPTRAESIAQRLLVLDPDDRDALRVRADVARQRGDERSYTATLERLLEGARRRLEGPEAEATLAHELGVAAMLRGDRGTAEVRLREAIESSAMAGPSLRALGILLAEQGRDAEAATHLRRAADLGALSPQDRVTLADVHERLGQSDQAARAILDAGDAAPKARRALAAGKLGYEAEARAAALAALSTDPHDQAVLTMLLRGLSPAGTIAQLEELVPKIGAERAAQMMERCAIDATPDDARLAIERAITLSPTANRWVALGRLAEGSSAIHAYACALTLDPGSPDAALGRAALADTPTAIQTISAALAANMGPPIGRARLALRLGELELEQGSLRPARAALARAMEEAAEAERGPDESFAQDLRVRASRSFAAVARAGGDPAAAETALAKVIDSGAANDTDLRLFAELLLDRGALSDAIEILDDLPNPGDLLTIALERAGEPARLVDHLTNDAAGRPPAEARPLFVRAASLALDALNDPPRAVTLLERAVPLGPTDPEIWERIGTIRRDRLKDNEAAARSFARAYGADPSRTHLLLFLGDFHHAGEEWTPARDYYLSLVEARALPREHAPRVHLRLAQYARRRADAIEEEAQLRKSTELEASVEGWRRLVEIYRMREDKLRLEQALLALSELLDPTERLALLREARDLQGPAPMAELDERILALDQNDAPARARILDRLRHSEDPSALLDRLERDVEAALASGVASFGAELPLELGRVSLQRHDFTRAARGFHLAVDLGGGIPAAEGAVTAFRALGRLPELATIIERVRATEKNERAREAFDQVLLSVYLEIGSDQALPLIDAARRRGVELPIEGGAYRRLLRAEGRLEELLADLDRAAEHAAPEARLPLELEAVDLLEGPLRRLNEAARRLAALYEEYPTQRELAARARTVYLAADEPIYALGIVDQELSRAHAEDIPALKITRGEILLAAGADAEAEAEFLHALITTKRVGRAHAALADVYRKRGDLASALEHLIAAADAPDLEPARAAACAVDAADVLLIEGDNATAERLYQLAAALDPADRRSLDALIRLASAQGAYERQADLLGRAASLTADRRERARIMHERAILFEKELGRDLDAYRAYREAVACDPSLREAVRSLRVLAEARGEWAVAAEQLYREVALSEDVRERARIHLRLARMHEEHLFDTAAALRNLEQAAELTGLSQNDESESPWPSLIRLYAEARRFGDAANAADRHVSSLSAETPPATRLEALERAAALHARAGDPARAEALRTEARKLGHFDSSRLEELLSGKTPDAQRNALEERLRTEPEGEGRLTLLRRLLTLLGSTDDLPELDARSQELLSRAPDDPAAFLARRRLLELRRDTAGLIALLRARSLVTTDLRERAERRYEAGRIAEAQLYDVPSAAADYEAALDADPDHHAALEALADLAYRTRHLQRARALYDRLGDRATTLAVDEVARRRGELAEEVGDADKARIAYADAISHNPSNLAAQQALARVALELGDDRGAYEALRAVLELLPHDALDRAAELRRHLAELAARLGELDDARALLEAMFVEDSRRTDVLVALTEVYERTAHFREAAELYERRALLAERNEERAELLFARGEALLRAGDRETASDAFLKAADLNPRHAPTLRRLVRHYLQEGDLDALGEVVEEIEALGMPLAEVAIDAGIGLALRGDEARGTIVAAMGQPTPATAADAIAAMPWPASASFDAALRVALRAIGGSAQARDRLLTVLEELCNEPGGALPVRYAMASLFEQAGEQARARIQLEVLAFLSPSAAIDARLAALGPPNLPEPTADQIVAAAARGTLRDVLCDLGPLVLGLSVAPLTVEPAVDMTTRIAPVASLFGYAKMDVVLLDRLADPAWAEPTRPPRLLLQRRFGGDVRAARFAAARALHALHAGLGLIHARSADDVNALFRAAAALFLPDLRTDGSFVRAWQAELAALGLRPETLPEAVRARLEVSLANLVVDRAAADEVGEYGIAERLTANRVAYVVTGDLRGGLVALCPASATDLPARQRALHEEPAIADLIEFAMTLGGA